MSSFSGRPSRESKESSTSQPITPQPITFQSITSLPSIFQVSEDFTNVLRHLLGFLDQHNLMGIAFIALCIYLLGGFGYGIGSAGILTSGLLQHDRNWGFSSYELAPYILILVGLIIVVSSSHPVSFSGALRYSYLNGNSLTTAFTQHLPNWSVYPTLAILILFPVSRLSLVVAGLVFWQYVLYRYRQEVRSIIENVDKACYEAKLAVERSREHVEAAASYEKQALDIVIVARRDARMAQSVKITDFFDLAAESWASMGRVTAPLETMSKEAANVKELAEQMQSAGAVQQDAGMDSDDEDADEAGNDDDVDGTIADMLVENAEEAVDSCEEATSQMKLAQATIADSRNAINRVDAARKAEIKNAEDAENSLVTLAAYIRNMAGDLLKANQSFEMVKWSAEQAKAYAVVGDISLADTSQNTSKSEANDVVKEEKNLRTTMVRAHDLLLNMQLGKKWLA